MHGDLWFGCGSAAEGRTLWREMLSRREARIVYWPFALAAVVDRDFAELGHVVRRPGTLRAWLRAYAAATSTTASYNSILEAATPGDADKPARTTTIAYREILERMWLIEEVPAWTGVGSIMTALGASPKHHLCDPALAARLLNVSSDSLLEQANPGTVPLPRHGSLIGALFESLVTLSVQTYAEALGARVSHLRTRRGEHEVDLIVERGDGKIVAIEVKLTAIPDRDDVKHLRWLQDRLGDDLLDAVLVTTGPAAYRRDDGIAVVPAELLGP
jgi:predicted AAA+ superfamily ATPase